MVDFGKLRAQKSKPKAIDPIEIFRRLPKPVGINDLYTSQAEVLQAWYNKRQQRDTIIKLHTGGGKTLVGLLIALSTLNETGEPVLYLTPNSQLAKQTIEKARDIGIPAVEYEAGGGKPLNDDFLNGNAIMVGTYKSLFHGKSKFGIRGGGHPQNVSAIILDDAHAAFSVIRESFTLDISAKDKRDLYCELSGLFRKAFKQTDRLGTFDDIIEGVEFAVLEVPYWAWQDKIDAVRSLLKSADDGYVWPLLRDNLHMCHAFISRKSFTITPVLPLVNLFPTFHDAPRRIYMSATIADDSEIIRIFDAYPTAVRNALTSRSLAGVSERMILTPDLMPFEFNTKEGISRLLEWTKKRQLGSVILVSADHLLEGWANVATIAKGSADVQKHITALQEKKEFGPIVFSNRYDGIDLPGDSCRLLVISGLPAGTSNYELFRASALFGSNTITRMIAQRIEQGMGRGARGAGDYCVVILTGSDLSGWVSKNANLAFLTSATKAQLEMGTSISREVKSLKDIADIMNKSYTRNKEWVEYHAETLAELVDDAESQEHSFTQAQVERSAFNHWNDGDSQLAIREISDFLYPKNSLDPQMCGWMEQLAARIAYNWGNHELAEDYQRKAYNHNRNLVRPKVLPPYRPLPTCESQAEAIVAYLKQFNYRIGVLKFFEETISFLHNNATANQFEQALSDFAKMIGLQSERHDVNGEGPDVLWLLPSKTGLVIEAKSRKQDKNPLNKEQHGQLLVASEWFTKQYPDYRCVRVSVHPKNEATKAAVAGASHALTFNKLGNFVADARLLLTALCKSQLPDSELLNECNRLLAESPIRHDRIIKNYLSVFIEVE